MAMGYGHGLGMATGGPSLHPRPKRRAAPKPKKGYCQHCGQSVTPAHGSPMHQQQMAAPAAPGNSMMAAMNQPMPPPPGGPPGVGG
jgi:hypothetical protein